MQCSLRAKMTASGKFKNNSQTFLYESSDTFWSGNVAICILKYLSTCYNKDAILLPYYPKDVIRIELFIIAEDGYVTFKLFRLV